VDLLESVWIFRKHHLYRFVLDIQARHPFLILNQNRTLFKFKKAFLKFFDAFDVGESLLDVMTKENGLMPGVCR
jgi:hypothetical protein